MKTTHLFFSCAIVGALGILPATAQWNGSNGPNGAIARNGSVGIGVGVNGTNAKLDVGGSGICRNTFTIGQNTQGSATLHVIGNMIHGTANSAGTNSFAGGISTDASGTFANGTASFAYGENCGTFSSNSVAMGTNAKVTAANSMAFGRFVQSTATGNAIIGSGLNASNSFANNMTNSLMVGFNHTNNNQPTLFVGPTFTGSQFGNVGIGTTPTFFTLDVNGTVNATGGYSQISDRRYKENIQQLENAMDRVRQIKGVQYTFNHGAFPEMNFTEGTRIGFIAQDLKEIVPEAVWQDDDGYYSVEYVAMIPLLVEALKEKDAEIQAIRAELEKLQNTGPTGPVDPQGKGDVRGSMTEVASGFELGQNSPNPFTGQTDIRYSVPEFTSNASLIIFNLSGTQVEAWPLTETEGTVTIGSDRLAAGQYLYSIVVEGQVITTRKMLVMNH